MLQTQLREAQQELKEAVQQHKDDLAALQEEGSTLLQDKIDLQKEVSTAHPAP
jgi:centrosomal protein CEP250